MTALLGAGYHACHRCGGGLPSEVEPDLVCHCGTLWAPANSDNPWPEVAEQEIYDWQTIGSLLTMRSGGRCEIRSPECLAARWNGHLAGLDPNKTSIHHRRPRGQGGTRRTDVHSLAALINTCGHGTIGCHWYTENNPDWAFARGFKVANIGQESVTDCALRPVTLWSGRRVLLDPIQPRYIACWGPRLYDLDMRKSAS